MTRNEEGMRQLIYIMGLRAEGTSSTASSVWVTVEFFGRGRSPPGAAVRSARHGRSKVCARKTPCHDGQVWAAEHEIPHV